jgi:hypothetical protein
VRCNRSGSAAKIRDHPSTDFEERSNSLVFTRSGLRHDNCRDTNDQADQDQGESREQIQLVGTSLQTDRIEYVSQNVVAMRMCGDFLVLLVDIASLFRHCERQEAEVSS